MPIITLTTDFGLNDIFVGVMKGVIWAICPQAHIVDLTHAIPPQNILKGALLLARGVPFFPEGAIHLAVVDPGVGTERRPLAMKAGEHFFVGPDNGLFTAVLEAAEAKGMPIEAVHLTNPKYWRPALSQTFHGRDLFAPVAAHLANGVSLADLGPRIQDPVRIPLPRPEQTASGWRAHVTDIDAFGNLITDLPVESLKNTEGVLVHVGRFQIRGLAKTYGEHLPGELVALKNSAGLLEIAIVNGNAAALTGARIGDAVEVVE